jgi:FKBP-type peptidyl-prolyl cis-trans isomerase FkpA
MSTTLPSGLQYEDTVVGEGAEARAGQHVSVHYTGWLHDPTAAHGRGRKFDSSKDRGQPFAFGLGDQPLASTQLQAVQPIYTGGRISAGIRRAEAGIDSADRTFDRATSRVRTT